MVILFWHSIAQCKYTDAFMHEHQKYQKTMKIYTIFIYEQFGFKIVYSIYRI